MKKTYRHRILPYLLTTFSGAAVTFIPLGASAQTTAAYPDKPIRLVVPYPPGGSIDAMGRIVGNQLSELLKQPVIIENRPGASGTVGASQVARAKPDGYTLCMCAGTSLTIGNLLYDTAPQNPTEDFTPIMTIAAAPFVAAVNASSPADNMQKLVELAQQKGTNFMIGGISAGTPSRLAGEAFRAATGAQATMIPYNGSAPMLTALLSGDLDVIYDTPDVVMPHAQEGKLKVLGVAQPERLTKYPDIPTMQDHGFTDFSFQLWTAVVAPKDTPQPIVRKLESVLKTSLETPSVKRDLEARGLIVLAEGADTTLQRMKAEAERNAAFVQKAQ